MDSVISLDNGINVASWFLSALLFLYGVFPILHNFSLWIDSTRGAILCIVGLIVGQICLLIGLQLLYGHAQQSVRFPNFMEFLSNWPPFFVPIFFSGILVARLKFIRCSLQSDRQAVHLYSLIWLVPCAMLLCGYCFPPIPSRFRDLVSIEPLWRTILPAPIVCVMLYTLSDPMDFLARALDSPIFSRYASLSFSCYLVQYPVFNML